MSQSAFDIDFWLKKPQVEVKNMNKKKKKKQKLRFEAKVEATLAAEAEADAEEIMMAGESEERMVDKNQKSEMNTEITAEKTEKNTEIASATTHDFEKSQKMKKSFEHSVLAVEQAIIEGNPIDNQHFMIVIFFSLFVNDRH